MKTQHIILGGGCFWGLEHLLNQFKGVKDTKVGYCGGDIENPTYSDVKTGDSGHAESVKVSFDPKEVTLAEILHYFFKIHDPTTVDRQGNDIGSQYRSVIFVNDQIEKKIVQAVIEEVEGMGRFANKVQTRIERGAIFYTAEEYHQKYLIKNPGGYSCHFERN